MAKDKTYSIEEIEEMEKRKKELTKEISKAKRAIAKKEQEEREKQRQERINKVGALVEKYSGEITNLEAFENYLKQYGSYIKKTQAAE